MNAVHYDRAKEFGTYSLHSYIIMFMDGWYLTPLISHCCRQHTQKGEGATRVLVVQQDGLTMSQINFCLLAPLY